MPRGEVVVLRKYSNEAEARLDASVLEANGIPAEVSADPVVRSEYLGSILDLDDSDPH